MTTKFHRRGYIWVFSFLVLLFSVSTQGTGQENRKKNNKFSLNWTFDSGGTTANVPTAQRGHLIFGNDAKLVFSVDPKTGKVNWKFEADGPISGAPAIFDDKVYVSTHIGSLYCLRIDNGNKIWKIKKNLKKPHNENFSSPAVHKSQVYVANSKNKLFCLDAENGDVLWTHKTRSSISAVPSVSNGRVLVASFDEHLYCLRADDGSIQWTFNAKRSLDSGAAVHNNKVYLSNDFGRVFCLSLETGELFWENDITDFRLSSPSIRKGSLVIGGQNRVFCLNPKTGEKIWQFKGREEFKSSYIGPANNSYPAVSEDRVYVINGKAHIFCLDLNSGKLHWSMDIGKTAKTTPILFQDTIYVLRLGKLFAIEDETGKSTSNWPTLGANSSRTGTVETGETGETSD